MSHTYEKDTWYDVEIENVEMRKSQPNKDTGLTTWLMNFQLKSTANGTIYYTQPVNEANRGYVVKLLTRLGVPVEDLAKKALWTTPNQWLRGVAASIKTEEYPPDSGKIKVKVLTNQKQQRGSKFAAPANEVATFADSAAAMFKLDGATGADDDVPF